MKRVLNILVCLLIFSTSTSLAEQAWEITTGCSGGVTGGGGGYTVLSDGKLFQWQAPTPTASTKKLLGKIECAAAEALRARLEAISFRDIDFKESSNMTCSVTLREGLTDHQVTWPVSDPFPPQEVMDIFYDIEALAMQKK
jgi:hypothetical protein